MCLNTLSTHVLGLRACMHAVWTRVEPCRDTCGRGCAGIFKAAPEPIPFLSKWKINQISCGLEHVGLPLTTFLFGILHCLSMKGEHVKEEEDRALHDLSYISILHPRHELC